VAAGARLPYALARSHLVRGDVRRARGDGEGARAAYDEALSLARSVSDAVGVAAALTRKARLSQLRGADDEAMTLLEEAISLQVASGDGGQVTSLEALAGVAVQQRRASAAAGLFGAAQALRTAWGCPRTPFESGDYEVDLERLRAAVDPAELDAAWAQGAAMSLDDAVALARRGRGSRDRPSYGWASLSPTERQIVDLVAEGLTNREIGDRLFISDRTVQGHLSRVFPKLGVTSRREIREAVRQR
jgi:DNA-binding CsgD family transcriptional regulator/tetratricopeptide (TPR) repeat protein